MDKIINSHIDEIEELSRQLDIVIEQEISQLDIDKVIDNPATALAEVVDSIKEIFLDKYSDKAISLGIDLGKVIEKRIKQDKGIKIDDSDNPRLNDTDKDNKQD